MKFEFENLFYRAFFISLSAIYSVRAEDELRDLAP